jgi:hypothetical protein
MAVSLGPYMWMLNMKLMDFAAEINKIMDLCVLIDPLHVAAKSINSELLRWSEMKLLQGEGRTDIRMSCT